MCVYLCMNVCVFMYEKKRQKNTWNLLEAKTKLQDLEFSSSCKECLLICWL